MKEMREPTCRAVQFSAFDALKGYNEMLTKVRREKEPRRELSDDEIEKLDRTLQSLAKGDRVKIRYYLTDCYTTLIGTVREIDLLGQTLKIEKTVIPFADIGRLTVTI